MKRLHIGCGLNTPEGWVHLDGSWNAWLTKYPILGKVLNLFRIVRGRKLNIGWSSEIIIHDVRKPLPFPRESMSAIYASHLLEHLYLEDGKFLLKECFRVLKPNGILRMVVPDLRSAILEYLRGKSSNGYYEMDGMNRAERLNKRLFLRTFAPPSGNAFYKFYTSVKDFHSHKFMYDADSLVSYFKKAGFTTAKEMQFLESQIEGIEKVEKKESFLNEGGICVEGVKQGENVLKSA